MAYFDHNATTPLAPLARETWLKAVDEHWQNPSSPYRDAAKVRIRLDSARERLAELLGADAKHLVFNSGATESAHAILSYLATVSPVRPVLVNPTEHPCVLAAAKQAFGNRVVLGTVGVNGVFQTDVWEARIRGGEFAAVVLMAANNETGVIQPWSELARLCRESGTPLVCDASQWLGKLAASGLGSADWIFGAGHKFGGPKGVGFLKLPASARGFCSQPGGEQEHGFRGGTENLPSIWAMVAALAEAEQKKVFLELERLHWRQAFEQELVAALPGCRVIGVGAERLWNTVSVVMPHTENQRWVLKLDKRGHQVSTGSACATGKTGPSHVLHAMGVPVEEARRVIRVSAGWETAREDWNELRESILAVAAELGGDQNVVVP